MKKLNKVPAVQAKKPATTAVAKPRAMVSQFYRHTRGTPFFSGNLRLKDFTKQDFESGKLPVAPHILTTHGVGGVACSTVNMKGSLLDLKDGRLFDSSGIKRQVSFKCGHAAASFAKSKGALHTVRIKNGPRKGTHTGYVMGQFKDFYVGFIAKDGSWGYTLENQQLPEGRNSDHVFELVK